MGSQAGGSHTAGFMGVSVTIIWVVSTKLVWFRIMAVVFPLESPRSAAAPFKCLIRLETREDH